MNTFKKSLIVTALATTSMGVFAASSFSDLDVDKDGAISQSEAAVDANIMSQFRELDTNGDGELSKAEFSKAE